jgi:hypothetical protein
LTAVTRFGFVAVIANGHWKPGIGDPTVMGWATVIAYGTASVLCIWAAMKKPKGLGPTDLSKHWMFWSTLGVIMLLLAINKQLDLQMWLWLTGRNMAKANGWYEQRRTIQVASMLAISVVAGAGLAYFTWLTRSAFRQRLLALLGMVFTVCFILIRASSLHHIDTVLEWRVAGVKTDWILEIGGILLVIIAALKAIEAPRKEQNVA